MERRSQCLFKASKDRLTLVYETITAGDFELKPVLIYHSENPTSLKNYDKFTLPVSYKWNNKTRTTAHPTTRFTEYFQPAVETYCSEKKIPFKILLTIGNVPGHPRALMEMHNETDAVFMPVNITSTLQLMD